MLYRIAKEIGGVASVDELLERCDMVDLQEWTLMIEMWNEVPDV